jgi:hypothetical protein
MCISCDIIAENDLYTQSRQQIQLIISWGLWVKTCFKSTSAQTCLQVVRADHSNDQELQQEAAASKVALSKKAVRNWRAETRSIVSQLGKVRQMTPSA